MVTLRGWDEREKAGRQHGLTFCGVYIKNRVVKIRPIDASGNIIFLTNITRLYYFTGMDIMHAGVE